MSTCNYEARKLGVHSGMPIAFAKKLAKNGTFALRAIVVFAKTKEKTKDEEHLGKENQ